MCRGARALCTRTARSGAQKEGGKPGFEGDRAGKQREFDELLTYAQQREDERLQALELDRLIDDLEIPQCVEEARILKRPDRDWEYVDAEQLRQHINRKRRVEGQVFGDYEEVRFLEYFEPVEPRRTRRQWTAGD